MKAWIKASRIPAQLFIFPALLLGQGIALYNGYSIHLLHFTIIHLYGIFMHLFIVYGNDYADFESDKVNQTFTPFTGGSRVLVDNLLSKNSLKNGFIVMGTLTLITGLIMAVLSQSILPFILVLFGLIIFQMYSFNPVKLSYRGYGETLQMLGVGIILPLVGYLVQGGSIDLFLFSMIIILLPSQLAMALSTSMPDYPSDMKTKKHTTVVKIGPKYSKLFVIFLYLITGISLLLLNLNGTSLVYPFIGITLTLFIAFLAIKFSTLPGTQSLFFFVAFSILTNTYFVLSMGLQFIFT